MTSRLLVSAGLVVAGIAVLWAVYLVPLAAVLNVGYGISGFRHYKPYSYAQVVSTVHTETNQYAVDVISCLPEDATAWVTTEKGTWIPVMGRIDSEVNYSHQWLFSVPKDDQPVALGVHFGNVEHQWTLGPNPQLQYPWWYRVAPSWAKRSLGRRTGLDASGTVGAPEVGGTATRDASGTSDLTGLIVTEGREQEDLGWIIEHQLQPGIQEVVRWTPLSRHVFGTC